MQDLFRARGGRVSRGWRLDRDLFPEYRVQEDPASLRLDGLVLRGKIVVHHLDRLFGHSTNSAVRPSSDRVRGHLTCPPTSESVYSSEYGR